MFHKLLLAATITFSLNLFINVSVPSGTSQVQTPPVDQALHLARILPNAF